MRTLRWARRIAIGLVLGAIATVAFAWRIAAVTPPVAPVPAETTADVTVRAPKAGQFVRGVEIRCGPHAYLRRAWSVEPWDDISTKTINDRLTESCPLWLPRDLGRAAMEELHVGWPLLAMRSGWCKGIRRSYLSSSGVMLPVSPLWPGFLGNTAIFGSVYVALATAFGAVLTRLGRRMHEARRERVARVFAWTWRAALGLAFGVGVTVGGAWWCAARAGPGVVLGGSWGLGGFGGLGAAPPPVVRSTTYHDPTSGEIYDVQESGGFGWSCLYALRLSPIGNPFPASAVPPPAWLAARLRMLTDWREVRFGWPLRTMTTGVSVDTVYGFGQPGRVLNLSTSGREYLLPVTPAWGGFIPNTAALAGAYITAMTILARRHRERRAGRCPKCLYDLRGLPANSTCPECGVATA